MHERWTVGEAARVARVTVRTLHHYDEIGLLVPSDRTASGYRLYSRADLERLQQIRLHQELGFTLDGIAEVLDRPPLDRVRALRTQRDLLEEKIRDTEAIVRAVDRTLAAMEGGGEMSTEEMFEGFEPLDGAPDDVRAHHSEHARETHRRWGETDAYRESMRRARRYAKADWARIKAEAAGTEARMAELMASGADPEGTEATAVAEAMRQHIERWFYPCPPAMHAGLADLYEADARFRAHYDRRAPGLARYAAHAIRANAAKTGG